MLRKLISYLVIVSIFISDLAGWGDNLACAMLNSTKEEERYSIFLHHRDLPGASDQSSSTRRVTEKKQSQENPDLPQSITLRARIVKNYIADNQAKAQIKRYDEEVYNPNLIYEFQRLSSQIPFTSISFIYEEIGFLENNGEERIFYGKKCGKGELVLPEGNIIYTKPYLYLENNIFIAEYRDYAEGCAYYLFPFGVSAKGDEPIRFYYPYAGMMSNGNDIKGAEQAYFSLDRIYGHETGISRACHHDLAHKGIDFLTTGKEGWVKTRSQDNEYHRSVFDVSEEQGISAGAALCGGYAKFEHRQQTSKGFLQQVYKSFRYTHPGNNPNLVDILFVQDLDYYALTQFVDLPLQIDPSVQYLNAYLLNKLQETFQEKIQLKQDLIESDEQSHIAKALSPFWRDIQSSLVAAAKFIDQHPLLADLTINGLQFIMGGPLKFAITKIADYLAGDFIANSKEKAQQFLVEQLGIPPDQIELATAAIGMGVDLFLSRPVNILKSAKKVIEAAERRAIKRNFKHNFSLIHKGAPFPKPRSSLSALDLSVRKKTQKQCIGDPSQSGKDLIPSLDLAVRTEVKKGFVQTEKKALLSNEGKRVITNKVLIQKNSKPYLQQSSITSQSHTKHRTLEALDLKTSSKITREKRWLELANEPNSRLPKEAIDHINRHKGKKVQERFGLELAHKPKKAAVQGHDYKEAIPKTVADHRGIQHKFLKERSTGTTIAVPKNAKKGKLSLPEKGSLPK